MLVLLSCAKMMTRASTVTPPFTSMPLFKEEASAVAVQMAQYSVADLELLLHVNAKIAVENYKRYQSFHADEKEGLAALLAYTGIVFKHLDPTDFTDEDFLYAQEHLRITSFCYGLLRPLDAIHSYRLEGHAKLAGFGGQTVFSFWQFRLTDVFIDIIKANGGVLVYLASDEMRGLFNWSKILKEVKVIVPEFHLWKNGKLSTIVVYTKMARGEMARFILKNRIEDLNELKSFSWEGFVYSDINSDGSKLVYVMGVK
ncbi:YaaA family protein [uncultured Bacteroides sp.]|uniref:YaaA family protein n=1 Tax=uncultured Bacteroides sp. TaxID=162156 RepID=UPI002AA8600F|nr:YaaA family protein [uncultured Bacteroides sp.]